jgi:hypothetical protein
LPTTGDDGARLPALRPEEPGAACGTGALRDGAERNEPPPRRRRGGGGCRGRRDLKTTRGESPRLPARSPMPARPRRRRASASGRSRPSRSWRRPSR